jgi:hypothetical protein
MSEIMGAFGHLVFRIFLKIWEFWGEISADSKGKSPLLG